MAPRAMILRRDHVEARRSLESMQRVMRSNGYGSGDPFALDPWMAVRSQRFGIPLNFESG